MSKCVLTYFIRTVEDTEIREVLEYAHGLTVEHLTFITDMFANEGIPVPHAFSSEDVNGEAPKLFSDTLMLHYLRQMGIGGMSSYAVALAGSTRPDLRDFFTHNLKTAAELFNKATTLLVRKGLLPKAPRVYPPDSTEWVQKEGWLKGMFGDRRPLNAVEITHLYLNSITNSIGKALMAGFAQTCPRRDIADYFLRARDISAKHIEVFGSLLRDDQLPAPQSLDAEVTPSTAAPFSDRLMLFHTLLLSTVGIGNYGMAVGASGRRDISACYVRLTAEVVTFVDDGAELMIREGWMEKIPGAVERDALFEASKA